MSPELMSPELASPESATSELLTREFSADAVDRETEGGWCDDFDAAADGSTSRARRKPNDDLLTVEEAKQQGYDWPVVVWIAVVHLGALAAPFFFTWKALGICVFLSWLTGSIGVCMGYHRYLTHGSFATYRPIRWLLAFIGGLSGEGSALTWVANHRKHHMFSDKEGDPHSPRDGNWWSHMLWFMPDFGRKHYQTMLARYAPDLAKDPVMRFLHTMCFCRHTSSAVCCSMRSAISAGTTTPVGRLSCGACSCGWSMCCT